MIRRISADEVLPLRSRVLRNGLPHSACHFKADRLSTTFHMGYFLADGTLVSVLSCQLENLADHEGVGYRLRGMASDTNLQGKGYGSRLLQHTVAYLSAEIQADYLWCNARRVAYGFYQNLGFQMLSDEFDIPGIGPHSVMYLGLA